MVINSERILKISSILLFGSMIIFNILNFLDKLTTYFGMKLGFIELNSRATYLFENYGLLQGILLQFFVALLGSIFIYFVIVKSLRFLVIQIPILFGYLIITINYLLAVISNIYYLVIR